MRKLRSILKVEYFAGDSMKVIGEICHQLSDHDMLQNAEILAVAERNMEVHGLPGFDKKKRRPKPSRQFLKTYHSGNELVLSSVRIERNASDRFLVIQKMAEQLSEYDGLSQNEIASLIKSYLEIHILEVDVEF